MRIVKVYEYLCSEKKEYTMSKQLLQSGTSIGANIAESQQAESRPDFISKRKIALKEAVETNYWLRLLYATYFLGNAEFSSIMDDCREIEKLLTAILKSIKSG